MLTTTYVDSFAEFYAEVGSYFKEHYKECEAYRQEHQKLNIDITLFQQLIDLGSMNIFKIEDDGEFIGYINVTINMSPLFKRAQAIIDFLYILPEHRGKNYASTAIEEVEVELKNRGLCDINLMLPDKEYSEAFGASLGYHKTSVVHTKYLGD